MNVRPVVNFNCQLSSCHFSQPFLAPHVGLPARKLGSDLASIWLQFRADFVPIFRPQFRASSACFPSQTVSNCLELSLTLHNFRRAAFPFLSRKWIGEIGKIGKIGQKTKGNLGCFVPKAKNRPTFVLFVCVFVCVFVSHNCAHFCAYYLPETRRTRGNKLARNELRREREICACLALKCVQVRRPSRKVRSLGRTEVAWVFLAASCWRRLLFWVAFWAKRAAQCHFVAVFISHLPPWTVSGNECLRETAERRASSTSKSCFCPPSGQLFRFRFGFRLSLRLSLTRAEWPSGVRPVGGVASV